MRDGFLDLGQVLDLDLSGAVNAFTADLYKQLKGAEGSLFLSPFCIWTCLAMAFAGARGETAAQMSGVLGLPAERPDVHEAIGKLLAGLDREPEPGNQTVELAIANGLWAQKDVQYSSAYLGLLEHGYRTHLNTVDFRTDGAGIGAAISAWVREKTRGKVNMTLDEFDPDICLVFANAIYFLGKWMSEFEVRDTSMQPFYWNDGEGQNMQETVSMIKQTSLFGYGETKNMQVLAMPYRGGEFEMVVLLPRKNDILPLLEDALSGQSIERWLAALNREEVTVTLPKFKFERAFGVVHPLVEMGMRDPFADSADFSGMTTDTPLKIDAIFHKAFVDVDEEGTEASAATELHCQLCSVDEEPPPPPKIFKADHPFLFLICDRASKTTLFIGRVSDASVLKREDPAVEARLKRERLEWKKEA